MKAYQAYVTYTPGRPKIFKGERGWGVIHGMSPIIDWFDSFENARNYASGLQ